MAKKFTERDFIEMAKDIHGEKYLYDNVKMRSFSKDVVEVICPDHGPFKVRAHGHIHSKTGCNWCKYGRASKKYTVDDFVQEAKKVHGGKYIYDRVVYKNCDSPVEIVCQDHGVFLQSPYNHLRGQRCRDCWYEEASEYYSHGVEVFIEKAKDVHGDKYVYDRVEYKNNKEQVEIGCPAHGYFRQTPHDHLAGNGCRDCGYADQGWGADGFYGTDRMSNLYVVTMSNEEETFIKVGLAKNFSDRMYHFSRETDYQVILKYYLTNLPANELFKIEQDILHRSGFKRHKPSADFRGKTECIEYSHINEVIEEIEKRCVE